MEVGREVHTCREDTLLVLAFALAVELLPPFRNKVKLRLVVYENFNLLTRSIQRITCGSIDSTRILCKRNVDVALAFHILSTLDKLGDVIASAGNRQQTYR